MDPWLVPSPLAGLLSRRIVVGQFKLGPKQLADPDVVERLPRKVARQAAQTLIDRITGNAKHMAALRKRAIGHDIRIPDDFEPSELSRLSRAVFHRVLNGSSLRALADVSWGQLLDNRRTGVERLPLMTAVAEIEWRLHHRHSALENVPRKSDTVQIDDLLAEVHINAVRDNDLRFGWRRFGTQEKLSDVLREWQAAEHALNPAQRKFVQRLHHAFRMTLAEDIEDIGRTLADVALVRMEARGRAAEIFAARYGARDYGPMLEAVGKRHACSGARVSQLDEILLKARGRHTLVSPAALAMLKRVQLAAYMEQPHVEQDVGLVLGSGHSLATFRRFCLNVLRPPLGVDIGREASVGALRKGVSADFTQVSAFKAALRYAKREARIAGAANITNVAGALALDTGAPVSRAALERMVDELPQATWLDREYGWFALDDLADSLVYARVRKILAVAANAVSIRDIGEALYRDSKLADESGGELGLAPMRILKQAILSWPDGIKEDARGFLYAPNGIETAEVLSPVELKLFKALVDRGGVATASSLVKEIGGNQGTVRSMLSYAVFAYPLGSGLYALRGWPVAERDLLSALADKVAERGEEPDGEKHSTVLVIRRQ